MNYSTCLTDNCVRTAQFDGLCLTHYRPASFHQTPARDLLFANIDRTPSSCLLWPHSLDSWGYPLVNFKRRTHRVCRLVCVHLYGPPDEGQVAAHGPCNETTCFNGAHLSWETEQENMLDKHRDGTMAQGNEHYMAKLTRSAIPSIRARVAGGESMKTVALDHGVHHETIKAVIVGRTWKHVR